MPGLPQHPQLPPPPRRGLTPAETWGANFQEAFSRLWTETLYVINALSRVDTLANRSSTPELDEIFFTASDTGQTFIAVSGAWRELGRLSGTTGGGVQFTEISDPTAPAANGAILYSRDNGAGKTQLCVRFNTGAIQVIATQP
jgi:hypothetical protein